jgi:diguanylate cyclase (GGDEF)-like protein
MGMRTSWTTVALGLVLPLALIVLILSADAAEGPKTAYVGVLAVVPMLAAVFAPPWMTVIVGVVTWLSAYGFGQVASDGNVAAQRVRLIIIALAGLAAVGASALRQSRERRLVEALQSAASVGPLREAAHTDQLTGLLNRRGLLESVPATSDAVRSVVVLDSDGLKQVNDSLGHQAGDDYLRAISGRLAGALARSDALARWGGDEFLVVLNLDTPAAREVINRAVRGVRATPVSLAGTLVEATVSAGIARWPAGATLDEALSAADGALYRAKALGGGQVVVAE